MTSILDVHHHIGPRGRWTGSQEPYDFAEAVEKHVRVLDEFRVDQACLIASHNTIVTGPQDVRWLNEQVAAASALKPERFPAAIGTVEPTMGDRGLEEIDYAIAELGMKAMAWHTAFQGVMTNSPAMVKYVRRVAEHGVPVFLHMIAEQVSEAPWRLLDVARQVPEAKIVALDAFTQVAQNDWIVAVGGTVPNVTYDLSLMLSGSKHLTEFVRRYGPDGLTFGSDYYDDTRTRVPGGLYEVRNADISDSDRDLILSGNARKLLGLAVPS
jgi:uncharacterized protein